MEKQNLSPYSGTVKIGGGLTPGGVFPVAHAKDVAIDDETGRLIDYIPIILTQTEYNELEREKVVKITYETPEGERKERIIEYDEEKIYLIKRGRPIEQ